MILMEESNGAALEVRRENKRARRFYEKCGLRQKGEMELDLGGPTVELRYWMALPEPSPALLKARALLEETTPLKTNCGKLCGNACCQPDEGGENGMLLLPGEEALYREAIPGFSFELKQDDTLGKGGWRLVCQGICPRQHRPLACRLFPLRIRLEGQGGGGGAAPFRVLAEVDPRAWALCPLPEEGGGRLNALNPAFVQGVEAAGQALVGDGRCLDFLHAEQRWLVEMRRL